MHTTYQAPPSRLAAAAVMLAGLLTCIAWVFDVPALTQLDRDHAPLHFNTALGFVLLGAGVIALRPPRAWGALACALAVLALGGVTLAQYLTGGDLGVDELFARARVSVASSHPGRMGPNSALALALAGGALAALACGRGLFAAAALAALAFALGAVSLIGYVTGLSSAYGWGDMTRMGPQAAVLISVLGAALLAEYAARMRVRRFIDLPWAGTLAGLVVAALAVLGWRALEDAMAAVSRLPELLLAAGLACAALLSVAISQTQQVVRRGTEILALERERLLAEERERLLRDVHDGVGGQLVSLLAQLEHGQAPRDTVRAVRAALDDLRLIIFSLEPSASDLASALALARAPLQKACAAAGLELAWDVARLPDGIELGPRNTLHVLRIAQEAVTNVIRHAQARRVRIRASAEPGGIVVRIEDDGLGLPDAAGSGGHGLRNMRRRAELIGGRLDLERLAPGTAICLSVPA